MTMKTGKIHSGASQAVLQYLRQHPDVQIPYIEISNALGYENSFTVANAVGYLLRTGINIKRPMRGVVIYHSGKIESTGREYTTRQEYFEYVGSSAGIPIVKGEDHEMYVLVPLAQFVKLRDE